eukprot:4272604-Pyramimonas_sp.AAC.1
MCGGVHPRAHCEALIHSGGLGLRAKLRVPFEAPDALNRLGPPSCASRTPRSWHAAALSHKRACTHPYTSFCSFQPEAELN